MLTRLTVQQYHSGTYHVGSSIIKYVREVHSWESMTALLYYKIFFIKWWYVDG